MFSYYIPPPYTYIRPQQPTKQKYSGQGKQKKNTTPLLDSEFEQNPDPEYWLLLLDGDGVGVIHIFKYPLYPLCIVLYMEILWEFFFNFTKFRNAQMQKHQQTENSFIKSMKGDEKQNVNLES